MQCEYCSHTLRSILLLLLYSHPSTPKRIVSLPLYPSKDVAVNMFIKVYVGQSGRY